MLETIGIIFAVLVFLAVFSRMADDQEIEQKKRKDELEYQKKQQEHELELQKKQQEHELEIKKLAGQILYIKNRLAKINNIRL